MTKVVIVGAGIVGAAIAYELSQVKGLNITLIDEGVPASGCTCAALGILMGAISQKLKGRAWQRRSTSIKRYHTLIPELESLTGLKIAYNSQGILMLRFMGEDIKQWEKLIQVRQSQGWHLELWEREQLQERCPHIKYSQVIGAVYSPQDLQIDPTGLTQALVAGAYKNGVNCQFGVKVQNTVATDLEGASIRQCCQVQTPIGDFDTDWLVIAAGLGSTPLTASLQQPLDLRPVIGQGLQIKLPQPLGVETFQPVITGNDVHIAPLGNREYGIGATVEMPNEQGEVNPSAELLEQVRQDAISFCPALAEGEITRTWVGKRPRPEGQPAPIIGRLPGYSNVLLATGHYRNGVLLAPVTGQEIRDLITLG